MKVFIAVSVLFSVVSTGIMYLLCVAASHAERHTQRLHLSDHF